MKVNKKVESLAQDIYDYCKKHYLWGDICMYFNGIALASWPDWAGENGEPVLEDLYLYNNKDPRTYFEYVNEPNIFSMTFEGPLYDVLNAYCPGWTKHEDNFIKIFEKHGLYYEMGHAWNLTAYKI